MVHEIVCVDCDDCDLYLFLDIIYVIGVKYPCVQKSKDKSIHNDLTLTLPVELV